MRRERLESVERARHELREELLKAQAAAEAAAQRATLVEQVRCRVLLMCAG